MNSLLVERSIARGARLLLAAPLVGLLDCGPVTVPTGVPSNDCATAASCAPLCSGAEGSPSDSCSAQGLSCSATNDGNACLSNAPFGEFVLVVDVPEGAYAPGSTLTVLSTDIACANRRSLCAAGETPMRCASSVAKAPGEDAGAASATGPCVQLPPMTQLPGAYLASKSFGNAVGLDLPAPTSIPVSATFVPEWTPPCEPVGCTPGPVPAANVNLPLPTLTAASFTTTNDDYGLLSLPAGVSGPSPSSSPIVWQVALPPGTHGAPGSYSEDVVAVPAWDARIPPLSIIGLAATDSTTLFSQYPPPTVQSVPPPVATAISVTGLPSAAGWTVYLEQAAAPAQIVSSRSSIGDRDGAAVLFTVATQGLAGLSIVVSPPPSSTGIPRLTQTYVKGLGAYPYPRIPPPLTVTGNVVSTGGTPVSARLHFVGTDLYASDGDGCSAAFGLTYDAFASTLDAHGSYRVTLPQGSYTVTIDPTGFPSGSAKSIVRAQFPPVNACPAPGDLTGQLLTPLSPATATGSVQVSDGRPLAGATVNFAPAAFLLTDPSAPAAVDWPRSFQVATDVHGKFSVQVDPGLYDVTVRPVDGTKFPWIVDTALDFPRPLRAPPLTLSVPAPSLLSLMIEDPTGNPLTQTIVRAYAFAPCTPAQTEQCNDVAVQIGEALTDATGTFEMFLTPTPFPAAGLGSEVEP